MDQAYPSGVFRLPSRLSGGSIRNFDDKLIGSRLVFSRWVTATHCLSINCKAVYLIWDILLYKTLSFNILQGPTYQKKSGDQTITVKSPDNKGYRIRLIRRSEAESMDIHCRTLSGIRIFTGEDIDIHRLNRSVKMSGSHFCQNCICRT